MPLKSLQQLDDDCSGDLACTLASAQSRTYFYLSQSQYC
jgi:hypothetical protein